MTQNDRILARLNEGLMCSMEPIDWEPRITRVAARVNDLRDAGHEIESVECRHREGARHVAYLLNGAAQRSLFDGGLG